MEDDNNKGYDQALMFYFGESALSTSYTIGFILIFNTSNCETT